MLGPRDIPVPRIDDPGIQAFPVDEAGRQVLQRFTRYGAVSSAIEIWSLRPDQTIALYLVYRDEKITAAYRAPPRKVAT